MVKNNINNKILDLCIHQQIQESLNFIKIIEILIKYTKDRLSLLEINKPLCFQKKKLYEYHTEKKELELKLKNNYKQLEEELKMIEKLQSNINN